MIKIFRCECRRLLCNKFFIGLLAVLLFYAGQVFYAVALPGVAHTAPFSPWSFGAYLAVLTAATPADPRRYALARCAAALVGVALLCLAALALAALLYARLFGWTDWGSLALPALVILAPPLVFALGSGWLLGRLRPWLLYVWMLLPFALAALPLPEALGLWNGGLCTSYPLTLGMLDPAFSLPAAAWAVQGLLLAAGVLLLLVAGKGKKVYNQ